MKKNSELISKQIADLEAKIAPLQSRVQGSYSQSETAHAQRSELLFSALVEGDVGSQKKIQEMKGKPQKINDEASDMEAAINVAMKRILDLRAQYASAILQEKIEECRSLCAQARTTLEELDKFAAPLLALVAARQDSENRLRIALLELAQIARPQKVRNSFDPPLAIENRARDLGSPVAVLAAHALGKGGSLDGMEIGERDKSRLDWEITSFDWIEKELQKIAPVETKDKAAA